jgi:hypothetical protein
VERRNGEEGMIEARAGREDIESIDIDRGAEKGADTGHEAETGIDIGEDTMSGTEVEVSKDVSGGTEVGARIDIDGEQKGKNEDDTPIINPDEAVLQILGTIEGITISTGGDLKTTPHLGTFKTRPLYSCHSKNPTEAQTSIVLLE